MPKETLFNIGDLVKIKSGGPVMAVKAVWGERQDTFECQWFAGKKLEVGRFPAASLLPAEEEPK
ncbi:YodC family protein [Pseudomonas sp. ABFPK]|uniref:YodC family protein n=1 Tax=Pseudomonas sp. ABFPK TaxID=1636605 RepID=UPI000778B458|nr:DUF2158 domain-containing protein [Pseudomonas sp. ABFPK]KYC14220.1 hypothetical protein WM94_27135 [Pseudomonas sp. ABFPK]